jgi:hypothetical protein
MAKYGMNGHKYGANGTCPHKGKGIKMQRLFWIDLIIYLLSVHIVSIKVFNGRLQAQRAVVLGFAFLLCVAGALLLDIENHFFDAAYFINILISYITPLFTIKNVKRARIIYFSLLYFGVTYTLIASFRWVVQLFSLDATLRFASNILIQCALLLACILLSKHPIFSATKQYIELITLKAKILLLGSVSLSVIFTFSVSELAVAASRTPFLTIAELSSAALIIMVGIMWPLIFISNSLNTCYKSDMKHLDEQMQLQTKHYEDFIQANEDIRKFKHDFDHLMFGIIGHANNGDTQAVLQLANECRQQTQEDNLSFKTGNFGADALFSNKQMKAQLFDTKLIFSGRIPNKYISTLDICVILGNALENAIEACATLPGKKTISVSSDMHNGFLSIHVSNPVPEDIFIDSHALATTKADKENHGIGLLSIYQAIKKYDGSMKISCKDKVFELSIRLDLNPML